MNKLDFKWKSFYPLLMNPITNPITRPITNFFSSFSAPHKNIDQQNIMLFFPFRQGANNVSQALSLKMVEWLICRIRTKVFGEKLSRRIQEWLTQLLVMHCGKCIQHAIANRLIGPYDYVNWYSFEPCIFERSGRAEKGSERIQETLQTTRSIKNKNTMYV